METGTPSYIGHTTQTLAAAGGREQFAGLYKKFAAVIMGMATRASHNNLRIAEDILHKVMLQLVHMPGALNETNDCAAFRHIAALTRAVIRETLPVARAQSGVNGCALAASPEAVLELTHHRGYTLADTAQALNISQEQTKTLLKTAMNKLKISQHG